MEYNRDGMKLLAHAVMKQAIKDYKERYKIVFLNGELATEKQLKKLAEIRSFFEGSMFKLYTDFDPQKLMKLIETEVEKEVMSMA